MIKVRYLLGALLLAAAGTASSAQWDPYRTTAAVTDAERARLDRVYLAKARANIERIRKGDVRLQVVDAQGRPVRARIKVDQVSHHFLFGNLVEDAFDDKWTEQERSTFFARFKDLFNFTELTLVKWSRYEPQPGRLRIKELDRQLDWAEQNDIAVKGHTIGWTHNGGTPRWLYGMAPGERMGRYKQHVHEMVTAYKGRIKVWDAINEPVTTIPMENALLDMRGEGKIDDGPRYNTKGITQEQTLPWVENTFRWAHAADPGGEFHINEFHILSKREMRAKYASLIRELLRRNIPLAGIGIQAHEPREMWFSTPEIVRAFDELAAFGLPLHITEFTPQSSGKAITGGWRAGTWTEQAQAQFAADFYTLAFGHPAMKSIHWWGLSDRSIWLPKGGLLDANLNPKPVYTSLHKLIKQSWMTRNVQLAADRGGRARFRGFYGKYKVTLSAPRGVSEDQLIEVRPGETNLFVLKLGSTTTTPRN
jgi:GH35 family endo-1,4-beta-xylanase